MSYENAFLIIIDGLAINTFEEASTPFIDSLLEKGATSATCEVDSIPTVSRGAHATLATGVTPDIHGIYGNRYYDRQKKQVCGFGPDRLRITTFAEVAERHGKSVAVTGNKGLGLSDGPIQLLSPGDEGGSGALEILGKGASIIRTIKNDPALRNSRNRILEQIQSRQATSYTKYVEFDNIAGDVVFDILTKNKPDILAVTYVGVDKSSHAYGPLSEEAFKTMSNVDRLIKLMFEKIDPAKTFCIITADHGNTAVSNYIDLWALASPEKVEALVTEGRRSARVYLCNRQDVAAVAEFYAAYDGVDEVQINYNDPYTIGDIFLYAAADTTFGVDTKVSRKACHGSLADSDRIVPIVVWNPLQQNGFQFRKQSDIAKALMVAMALPEFSSQLPTDG